MVILNWGHSVCFVSLKVDFSIFREWGAMCRCIAASPDEIQEMKNSRVIKRDRKIRLYTSIMHACVDKIVQLSLI